MHPGRCRAQGLAVPGTGEAAVEGQLRIDGKVAGRFASVSGLRTEVEIVEFVCPRGRGDCDDQDAIVWEGAVRKALWEMEALADGMERDAWASSRTGHDTQMNAIRNIKAIAVQPGDAFNETGATLAPNGVCASARGG